MILWDITGYVTWHVSSLQLVRHFSGVGAWSLSINSLYSIIAKASSKLRFNIDRFRHPIITPREESMGCKLGIDSWADTCCAGRHAFVEEFVEGKIVNATGFSPSLGSMQGLPKEDAQR